VGTAHLCNTRQATNASTSKDIACNPPATALQ
jgi:hypothetical protein